MARRRQTVDYGEVLAEIDGYYRRRLTGPAVLPDTPWQPVRIGPTWQTTPDGRWLLPERTLGWQSLAWCGLWLQHERGVPWRFTDEQARWWLWWYAVDDAGKWLFGEGVLQRLKGWGKDPLAAALCANELVGPCRFAGWDDGEPVAEDNPKAWVQLAAVSKEQTKNTMKVFPLLFSAEAVAAFRLQILNEKVHAAGGRLIEAVTSAPATLEGARPGLTLKNETHHWKKSNAGHDMADTIERNAAKGEGGESRTLAITNAYEPGEDSVAERDRDAYELVASGRALDVGLLYDSLEAPPDAPLTAEAAPAVVRSIRGDSTWLDAEDRIKKSILNPRNPPSRSRRFWYNQITAAEDAWTTPAEWDANRAEGLELAEGEPFGLFLDTSKSDDSTGLLGCRIDDGSVWRLGLWEKPKGDDGWTVPRPEVDFTVRDVFARFDVLGFFADPTPGDDDTGERYFDGLIDEWGREFGPKLAVKASQSGCAVRWSLSGERGAHQREFTEAVGQTLTEIKAGQVPHDGDRALRQHVLNARRRPTVLGVSIGKEHRESSRKIDLAVAMIGARMVRRRVLASKEWQRRQRRGSGRGRFIVLD